MSQRRFVDSIRVCITLLLLPPLFGRPTYESFQEEFAGAVIPRVRLDIFESPNQKLLLYTKQLRINHRARNKSHHPLHGRCLRSCPGGPVRLPFSLQSSAHTQSRKGDCPLRRPRLTWSHKYSATHFEYSRIISSKISVSSHTISSATCPPKARRVAINRKTQRDLIVFVLFFQGLNVKR